MNIADKAKNKIRKILRERSFNFCYDLFGAIPKSVKKMRGLRILVYHGVCNGHAARFNSRFLTSGLFEEHLVAIKECFNPISFSDYCNGNLSDEKLNVLVTFDDGLKNNYDNALPLLVKHNIPAMFFISTLNMKGHHWLFNDVLDVFSEIGPLDIIIKEMEFTKQKKGMHLRYLNTDNVSLAEFFHNNGYEERQSVIEDIFNITPVKKFETHLEYLALMNNEEIKNVASTPGITIGSHGVTHVDFSNVNNVELLFEITKSKEYLEAITGQKCETLAFPYGSYNSKDLELFKNSGYKHLFGSEKINNIKDRSQIVERFTVNPYVSAINQMYYIAKGNYE